MDGSASFLETVCERVRGYLDDPDIEAKYSNTYLVQHVVMPAFVEVLSRINLTAANPVLLRMSMPLVSGQAHYQLPPCVGEVWRICLLQDDGTVDSEALPRGLWHARGPNFHLENNVVSFRPVPDLDLPDLEVWYSHNGDFLPVYSEGQSSAELNADKDELAIDVSATTTLGTVDRRVNAYAGQLLRVTSASGVCEERVVDSWTPVMAGDTPTNTWTATFRVPLQYAGEGAIAAWEFAPCGLESVVECVAARAALKLCAYKRVPATHYAILQKEYQNAFKTAQDHLANIQMRTPKHWDKNTVDNPTGRWWRLNAS